MPEVASQQTVLQVGAESSPGTAVACSKQLTLSTLEMGPNLDFKLFPGMGRRFNAAAGLNKNSVAGKIGGPLSYTEIVYWLSACLGVATITTPSNGVLTRQWVWNPSLSAAITQKTLTVQNGSPVRAQQFPFGAVSDFGWKGNRDDVTQEHAIFGQAFTDNITLTSTPTIITPKAVQGEHMAFYADNTSGGLGGTKLLRTFDHSWKYSKAVGQVWPIDRANASFAATVDTKPDTEFYVEVTADSQGMGLYADAIADTTKYVRFEAQGDLIESVTPDYNYLLQLDAATRITKIDEFKDDKGLRCLGLHCSVIEDSSWGSGIMATLFTTLTAL